jgi:LGFP repeat
MHPEITAKWNALGGEKSWLRAHENHGVCRDGDGAWAAFKGGHIHWHLDTGAYATRDPIRKAWGKNDWEFGPWGYPVSDPIKLSASGAKDAPVEVQQFQKGYAVAIPKGQVEFREGESIHSLESMLSPLVEGGYADPRLRGEIDALPDVLRRSLRMVPGCADIQLARVNRMGHRGRFPRPHEWENLLPMLNPGEELLWVIKKKGVEFECYLGWKANRGALGGRSEAGRRRDSFLNLLNHFARRSFPESQTDELSATETCAVLSQALDLGGEHVTVVSGLPSPKTLEEDRQFAARDDNADLHASLNDVIEPFLNEAHPFCIVFTLARATDPEVRSRLGHLVKMRNSIAPDIKRQITHSDSTQHGTQTARGETTTSGISQQEQRWLGARLAQMLQGSNAYTTVRRQEGPKKQSFWSKAADVLLTPRRYMLEAPKNYQHSVAVSETKTDSESVQRGISTAATELDAALELMDESLNGMIKLLRTGTGTGAFHAAALVYAPNEDLGRRIGKSLAATLAGSKSHLHPFQVIPYHGGDACAHLALNVAAHQLFPVAILNTHYAAQMLLTPEAEVPGLRLKRNVFYGQAGQAPAANEGRLVWLGQKALFEGSTVRFCNDYPRTGALWEQAALEIPAKDLLSHLLITGTTGSGKTCRAIEILNKLDPDEFQVIVIESAKKTFRHSFGREGKGVRVFTLGESRENPLRINPLFFEPRTSLKQHISVLSDALSDLLPVEALIGPKLREAVQRAYIAAGWNIEQAIFDGVGQRRYPDTLDLYGQVLLVAAELGYSGELNQNYFGALTGRAQLFHDELYQDIFAWGGDRSLDELFGEDDAVIEMDALPPSEINMPGFILSVLLQRLRARQAECGARGRKQIVVIEEAHNLLHRRHEVEKSGRDAGGGKHLLHQLVRLLQEGRELGIGVIVIDQSPASLADAVIKNTNTKLVHRIADSEEARLIGSCLGMRDEDWRDLHELETGDCIVQTQRAGKPVKLAPLPEPKRRTTLSVGTNNPPDYARAQRLLDRLCTAQLPREEVARHARELIDACLGDFDLLRYVLRKFVMSRAARAAGAGADAAKKVSFELKNLAARLPQSAQELVLFLGDLAGGGCQFSELRGRFAQQVTELLGDEELCTDKDDTPQVGWTSPLWWTGPLAQLRDLLGTSDGWEDPEAIERFCQGLDLWNAGAVDENERLHIREQVRSEGNASTRRQASLVQALRRLANHGSSNTVAT